MFLIRPRIIKKSIKLLKLIYNVHHSQFDVIRFGDDVCSFKTVRQCYLLILVLYICTNLYGIFGLECESRPSCHIDWTALPSSPYSAYHQMFPSIVWHQINLLCSSLVLFCISSWIGFLFTPPIGQRFLIYPHLMSEAKKVELDKMLSFRRKCVKLALITEIMAITTGLAFCNANVLFVNAVYNVNVTSAVFWLLLNPAHIYFNAIWVCTLPFYVILSSKYITIQQETLMNKMKDINAKLCQISRSSKNRITRERIWLQYIDVNIQMCVVCKNLQEYSRFWSPYLTRLLVSLIAMQCYGFYIFLFVPNLPLVLRFMLLWLVFLLVINELVLVNRCAAVVKNSQRFTVLNRTFYQLYYRSRRMVRQFVFRNLVKAENLQESRLLHVYAFRWLGNSRITTKSFNIIISHIVLFFLFISKNNKR